MYELSEGKCDSNKPLVGGSNPSATTKVGVLPPNLEALPLRELLEMLLGEDGRRRLWCWHKSK